MATLDEALETVRALIAEAGSADVALSKWKVIATAFEEKHDWPSDLIVARGLLAILLLNGPRPATEVRCEAKECRVSRAALAVAAKELGIESGQFVRAGPVLMRFKPRKPGEWARMLQNLDAS